MPNTTEEVEVISKQQLVPVFIKSHNSQNEKAQIYITKQAKDLLVAVKAKRQGYSECLLASEAIIEKYGKAKNSAGPVQGHDGPLREQPTADDYKQASLILKDCEGSRIRANNEVFERKDLRPDEKDRLTIAIRQFAWRD